MTDHHQAPRPPADHAPTQKQQAYIRTLALQRGVSFTPPTSKAEASRLINELKRLRPTPAADRVRELRAVQADMATRRGDATRVRRFEVEGYGSTAEWSQRS